MSGLKIHYFIYEARTCRVKNAFRPFPQQGASNLTCFHCKYIKQYDGLLFDET